MHLDFRSSIFTMQSTRGYVNPAGSVGFLFAFYSYYSIAVTQYISITYSLAFGTQAHTHTHTLFLKYTFLYVHINARNTRLLLVDRIYLFVKTTWNSVISPFDDYFTRVLLKNKNSLLLKTRVLLKQEYY